MHRNIVSLFVEDGQKEQRMGGRHWKRVKWSGVQTAMEANDSNESAGSKARWQT